MAQVHVPGAHQVRGHCGAAAAAQTRCRPADRCRCCCLHCLALRALAETRPGFVEADVDHRIRSGILEILNRLPLGESLRPFAAPLCAVVTKQLVLDNEDNGITCMRILFDCHKHFHPAVEAEVQPFLSFFTALYGSWENNARYHFNEQFNQLYNGMMAAIATASSSSSGQSQPAPAAPLLPPRVICRSSESFKVSSESPLVVMTLLQSYARYVDGNVPTIIPLLMRALTTPAPKEPPPLPAALINLLTASSAPPPLFCRRRRRLSSGLRP